MFIFTPSARLSKEERSEGTTSGRSSSRFVEQQQRVQPKDKPEDDASCFPPVLLPDEDGDGHDPDRPAVSKQPQYVNAVRALVEDERDKRKLGNSSVAVDRCCQEELEEVEFEEEKLREEMG